MASRALDDLVVRIEADTTRLARELQKADRQVGQFDRNTSRSMRRFDMTLKSATRNMALFRNGVLAVAAAGGALALLGRQAIKTADNIANVADKLGLTVEQLQEYRFAAEQVGVAQQTVDMALQRFTRRMAEAAAGGGELKGILDQYGIAVRDSDGRMRDANDVLRDLADAMAGAETQAERLRIAFKAFDSEGVDLVRLLGGGSAAIDGFIARARELGVVIDASMIREAQEANRVLDEMEKILGVHLTRAGLSLVPVMRSVAEAMASEQFRGSLEMVIKLMEGVVWQLDAIATTMVWVRDMFRDLDGKSTRNLRLDLKGVNEELAEIDNKTERAAQRLAQLLSNDSPGPMDRLHIRQVNQDLLDLQHESAELEMKRQSIRRILTERTAPRAQETPPPLKVAEQSATPTATASQELRYEVAALESLIAARKRGSEAYRETARAIEIEKKARAENIDLSTAEGREWAKLAESQMRLAQTQSAALSVMDEARAPAEAYADEVERLNGLLRAGAIDQNAFDVSVERARETLIATDPVLSALSDGFDRLGQGIASAMTRGESAMDGFKNAARSMVDDLLQTMMRLTVINPIKNALFGFGLPTLGGLGFGGGTGPGLGTTGISSTTIAGLGFEKGGVIAGGRAVAGGRFTNFAGGGVFQRPTSFPMSGAVGRIGEADHAEAALPLVRMPDGAFGVRAAGGGRQGPAVVVEQQLNFALGVQPTVRAEIMNMMPEIAERTTRAVADAAGRGGAVADLIRGQRR